MADNISITPGTGVTVATDDIGGVQYQRIKNTWGANGVANDVSAATPMPTVQTGAIPAGSNVIGRVGIDQTTDGTTNLVAAKQNGTWNIGTVTPGTAATNLAKAIDSVAGATDTGVAVLATRFDTLATLTPASGDYASPRLTNRGAWWVSVDGGITPVARVTTNGLTSTRVVSAASTNATSLKTSAGQIARIDVFNTAASTRYIKIYNKASAPTVGTDVPIWTIPLLPNTGFSSDFTFGKYFSTGIAYAITGALADADTTTISAGDITGSIDWI